MCTCTGQCQPSLQVTFDLFRGGSQYRAGVVEVQVPVVFKRCLQSAFVKYLSFNYLKYCVCKNVKSRGNNYFVIKFAMNTRLDD